jgi:hypothetical protein
MECEYDVAPGSALKNLHSGKLCYREVGPVKHVSSEARSRYETLSEISTADDDLMHNGVCEC